MIDQPALRVLVIDDSRLDYLWIRRLLSQARNNQYLVEGSSAYAEGLESIHRQEHDVYLVDYRLGIDDGIDLIRQAAADGCDAPLILLTGFAEHEIETAAIEAGAADYLDKGSLSPDVLERALRYALQRKNLERSLCASQYSEAALLRKTQQFIDRLKALHALSMEMSEIHNPDELSRQPDEPEREEREVNDFMATPADEAADTLAAMPDGSLHFESLDLEMEMLLGQYRELLGGLIIRKNLEAEKKV